METTFITIHNLEPDANILFASATITKILGYEPEDVVGRSCFDYFHPDEVPFARNIHSRGVQLDKAAVLHYARIRGEDGQWIGCECVFTVVYQVLVACTSIYRGDEKNERRAAEAPAIRRLFASSPRDPRYHMLEHLSSKFRTPPQASLFEPRAALILNRFTRNLTVMYATNAVTSILGVTPEQLDGKSFYECMQENCLRDAIRCLESAKENDSIAYLRFWYRDPRHEEDREDEQMREASLSSDSDEDGGVELNSRMDVEVEGNFKIKVEDGLCGQDSRNFSEKETMDPSSSRTSSGKSSEMAQNAARAMFDGPRSSQSSASSMVPVREPLVQAPEPYEIEAVVSCTSDGLVVVLRRARPRIPSPARQVLPRRGDGLFAAPWALNPIRPHVFLPNPQQPFEHRLEAQIVPPGGPPQDELLASIQEVAVFAWSLVGINGNLANYGHGVPRGEAQPLAGIPVWNPYAVPRPVYPGPENQAAQRWAREKSGEYQDDRMRAVQNQQWENEFRHDQGFGDNGVGMKQPPTQAYQQDQHSQFGFANYNSPFGMSQSQRQPEQGLSLVSSGSMTNRMQPDYSSPGPSEGSRASRYLWY